MYFIWGIFFISFISIFSVWKYSRPITIDWQNVPPAPTKTTALAFSLGDEQFSYRFLGILLQSFGNTSGRYEALKNYDYDTLYEWFELLDGIDARSEYLPYLVTYYFGSAQTNPQLRFVAKFLEDVGIRIGRQKWKWLAQAIYIARYKLKDIEYARELAAKLAEHKDPNVGAWAKNMDAYIMAQMGDKEAAINLTLLLLKNNSQEMTVQEINLLTDYVCKDLMNEEQASSLDMCKQPLGFE